MVLAVSFALRAFTAWRGGQPVFGRTRIDSSRPRIAARALGDHRYREAGEILFSQADHLLFKLVSLLPAGVEIALGAPGWVSALFFAAASTWVIWLVGQAARAAGATEEESLLALVLAAGTTSLFYYARHFFPYDLSLGFLLLAPDYRTPRENVAVELPRSPASGRVSASSPTTAIGRWPRPRCRCMC